MITVYFVQHGIAVPKQVDAQRPLSEPGRAEVSRVATQLAKCKISIDTLFHSGKLRARQTAELIFATSTC